MPKKQTSAAKQFDLISIGGSTWDAIITADDATVLEEAGRRFLAYPYGQKLYLDQAFFGFGGGGSNVAVSVARLGLKTAFVGAMGHHHISDLIVENFQREKVDTAMIKRDPENLTGVSIVLTAPDGERSILLFRGANSHLEHKDIDWSTCTKTRWLYVSSLSGDSDKLYDRVAETARKHKARLAINPGATQIHRGTRGMHKALADCEVLMLNEEEARELLRQRGAAGETVADMLQTLQHINQGVVVITQGVEGSQATDGKRHARLPAFTQDRVNTIGAGDAFSSTFVVALDKGFDITEAIRFASLNASSVVADFTAQAGLLKWPELERRAKRAPEFKPIVTELK